MKYQPFNKKNIFHGLTILLISLAVSLSGIFLSSCHNAQDNALSPASLWTGTWGTAQQLVEPHNMPPAPTFPPDIFVWPEPHKPGPDHT